MSVMKCARNRTSCARSVVQCYASGEVRCGIVVSVVISICVVELSVPVFHIVVLALLVVHCNSSHSLLVAIFQIGVHCIFTAF